MALVWYVTSWDANVELVHGECLSVYQTFQFFNEVLHGWYSTQSNVHNKRDRGDLFTRDVTKVATTWSHPCIEHTTGKVDSQRSVLYCNIIQTFSGTHTAFKYLSIHLQLPYLQTQIRTRTKSRKGFLQISVCLYVCAIHTHTQTHTQTAGHLLKVGLIMQFFRSRCTTTTNIFWYKLLIPCPFNTFTAIVDLSRFNNSCLKSPASTLVDPTFQSRALRSFSLNQLRNPSL